MATLIRLKRRTRRARKKLILKARKQSPKRVELKAKRLIRKRRRISLSEDSAAHSTPRLSRLETNKTGHKIR